MKQHQASLGYHRRLNLREMWITSTPSNYELDESRGNKACLAVQASLSASLSITSLVIRRARIDAIPTEVLSSTLHAGRL